jgi:hypothetical protein
MMLKKSHHYPCDWNRWSYVQENNVQLPDEYDQIVTTRCCFLP